MLSETIAPLPFEWVVVACSNKAAHLPGAIVVLPLAPLLKAHLALME